jgi:hypothetical protein
VEQVLFMDQLVGYPSELKFRSSSKFKFEWTGSILINNYRQSLQSLIRKVGKHPTTTDKLKIFDSQRHLQAKIDSFHSKASTYLGSNLIEDEDIDHLTFGGLKVPENDSDDDMESDAESDVDVDPESDAPNPENLQLLLPSSLGKQLCNDYELLDLAQHELELRIGQANDALQELRVDLAHKAYLYRTKVREANNQTTKLRSLDHVHVIEESVKAHAAVYKLARKAMVQLGASQSVLNKYQDLCAADLKVKTHVHDPSIHGQRNSHLAWFWTIDVQNKDIESSMNSGWMDECNSPFYLKMNSLNSFLL